MRATLRTGGETLDLRCDDPPVADVLRAGADGELTPGSTGAPTVVVRVERVRDPFPTSGWPLLTRGVLHRDGVVVARDVCTSGFDMRVQLVGDVPEFVFRRRPPARTRLAAVVLSERACLLTREILLQYPVMWWATVQGRAPLHGSVIDTGAAVVLLAGASGVGKSTLVANEVSAGAAAASDNLCVTDGRSVWGVVEPLRLDGGRGRRTTHGRREAHLARRVDRLVPDVVAVLRRGGADETARPSSGPMTGGARMVPLDAHDAWRALATGTYTAGELRRFWPFVAMLAAGTGTGPVHPPVAPLCRVLAERARTVELVLAHAHGARIPVGPSPVSPVPPLASTAASVPALASEGAVVR
jgi:hypothetical protein